MSFTLSFKGRTLVNKVATCLMLSVLIGHQLLAQTDTGATFYFPLGANNRWQYKEPPPPYETFITEVRIGRDTTFPNSSAYHSLVTSNYGGADSIQLRYERQVGQNVFRYFPSQGKEFLIYDFSKNVGDTIAIYPSPINAGDTNVITVIDAGVTNVFGKLRKYMTFYNNEFPATLYWIDKIADSIGVIFSQIEPGYQLGLVGAIIDTVQYGVIAGVESRDCRIPDGFELSQSFPNPFNPSTTIRFSVPARSRVRLTIFNLLGQQVAELANEEMNPGSYERMWNANVASGLYFYRIEAVSVTDPGKKFVDVKKMVLLR